MLRDGWNDTKTSSSKLHPNNNAVTALFTRQTTGEAHVFVLHASPTHAAAVARHTVATQRAGKVTRA